MSDGHDIQTHPFTGGLLFTKAHIWQQKGGESSKGDKL